MSPLQDTLTPPGQVWMMAHVGGSGRLSSRCHNKTPRLGGFKQQKFSSHNSRGWKPKIKVSAWWVSGRTLQTTTSPPCPTWPSLCITLLEGQCPGVPVEAKTPLLSNQSSIPVTLFNLNYILRDPLSKDSHWGLGTQHLTGGEGGTNLESTALTI